MEVNILCLLNSDFKPFTLNRKRTYNFLILIQHCDFTFFYMGYIITSITLKGNCFYFNMSRFWIMKLMHQSTL